MLVLRDITFAHFIFFLKEEVDTLQTLCFKLIDNVIQNLKSRDVYHTVVIWRVWNQNSNPEHADENRGKMWAGHKRVVSALKLCFACDFFKHSKNHSDEPSDHVNLLHDISNEWVFSCKVELIKLQ
jgi:hypothetical protein